MEYLMFVRFVSLIILLSKACRLHYCRCCLLLTVPCCVHFHYTGNITSNHRILKICKMFHINQALCSIGQQLNAASLGNKSPIKINAEERVHFMAHFMSRYLINIASTYYLSSLGNHNSNSQNLRHSQLLTL